MGWKANTILVCKDDPRYLISRPAIDHDKSKSLFHVLTGPGGKFKSTNSFIDFIWPDEREWAIGVYEKGLVISTREPDLVYSPPKPILSYFPNCYVLALGLHSGSNFAAFAYYENGKLLRRFGSSQCDRLEINESGSRLPEEQNFWARYSSQAGSWCERGDDGSASELDVALGESLVFEVSKKFLGAELNGLDDGEDGYTDDEEDRFEKREIADFLPVDLFTVPSPPRPWWRFWA